MGYIKGKERGQSVLFPGTVDEYIAENNEVRAIAAFLGRLDFVKLRFVRGQAAGTGRPEWDSFFAQAGAGKPPQSGSDLVVREPAAGFQDDCGFSQRQRGRDQRSGGGVSPLVLARRTIWERNSGGGWEQVQSGEQQGAELHQEKVESDNRAGASQDQRVPGGGGGGG